MPELDPKVEELINEGHDHFQEAKFHLAARKYTCALALNEDPLRESVILSSRAACWLQNERFLEAVHDATTATRLDPLYAKAWAQAGQAFECLGQLENRVRCWIKAVECLENTPNSNEKRELLQFKKSLLSAQGALCTFTLDLQQCQHPWDIAAKLLPQLSKDELRSSAWLIFFAYRELQDGLSMLNKLHVNGKEVFALLGTTEQLSNAVLKDRQCLFIEDPEFLIKFQMQVFFERTVTRGWESEDLDKIKEDAVERLQQDGWDKLKAALSITIRSWIMRACLDCSLRGDRAGQVKFLNNAAEIIKWGQTTWSDISRDKKGAIFEETFLHAVQHLLLDACFEVTFASLALEQCAGFFNKLFSEAEEVINSAELAVAPLAKSLYFREKAAQQMLDPIEKARLYEKAAHYYVCAADCLPEDDEYYVTYLVFTVTDFKKTSVSVATILELVQRIKTSLLRMQTIWGKSLYACQGRDVLIDAVLGWESELSDLVEKLTRGFMDGAGHEPE
ncbi:hypothetical protein D9758_017140 [Tetrapyrgos nigripes]|uniref:Uncharacterized protein n=1 Tax=Tetrapyrgos nigripes TaxID=182062 RepID=A0A8H5BJI7_9AGAR|nr:hypothetical protein D9758_017140 [Tetrapyrgos nigripes]